MQPNFAPFPGFVTVAAAADLTEIDLSGLTGGCLGFVPNAVDADVQYWVYNSLSTDVVDDVVYRDTKTSAADPTAAGRWVRLDIEPV